MATGAMFGVVVLRVPGAVYLHGRRRGPLQDGCAWRLTGVKMSEMARRLPLDAVVAGSVATTSLGLLAWSGEVDSRAPGIAAALLLVVASASYAWHQLAPVSAFAIAVAAASAYLVLGYPGGAELPSLVAAFYAVAAAGRRWIAGTMAMAFLAVSVIHRVWAEGEEFLSVAVGSSVVLLVVLLGDGAHTRRALRAETQERMRMAAVEKEAEARARVAEERLRLAHELHDVVAHSITAMTVQASAAIDLLDHDPARAREPLDGLRIAARAAMSELRSVLEVLRAPDRVADRSPVKRLSDASELVDTLSQAGIAVHLTVEGVGGADLPAVIDAAGYRVVQEACTNVLRHAGASTVGVRIASEALMTFIEVVDDGRGGPAPTDDGYGLLGLRERVTAVGGCLEAGPVSGGGFRVAATLPHASGGTP